MTIIAARQASRNLTWLGRRAANVDLTRVRTWTSTTGIDDAHHRRSVWSTQLKQFSHKSIVERVQPLAAVIPGNRRSRRKDIACSDRETGGHGASDDAL